MALVVPVFSIELLSKPGLSRVAEEHPLFMGHLSSLDLWKDASSSRFKYITLLVILRQHALKHGDSNIRIKASFSFFLGWWWGGNWKVVVLGWEELCTLS